MSSFAKRKARKITVQEDEDEPQITAVPVQQEEPQEPVAQAVFKARPKPFKSSALRKGINIADETESKDSTEADDTEEGGAPLRVRSSAKLKKRGSSSRLSFGLDSGARVGAGTDDDDAMVLGDELPTIAPKKISLAATATENSAYKRGITKNSRLPLRSMETEDDRPRYSKEYLSELQSSTPNAPASLGSLNITDDDVEMSLDPSELEGATIVEPTSSSIVDPRAEPATTSILTESEIAEKKSRRARLAQKVDSKDFISLSDEEEDGARGAGESYLTVLSRSAKPSKEKRLTKDDDLVDDDSFFVEDGGLSLGRKAEREARRRKRADMQSMIAAAEGVEGDETSDDSEAERRAAYEAAQTRAGMDGLAEERDSQRRRFHARDGARAAIPPKITPLPDLSVLVQEFRASVARQEGGVQRMRGRIQGLRGERDGILAREPEVQRLLDEAGERYRGLMGGGASVDSGNAQQEEGFAAAAALVDQAAMGGARGLDSLGTTPVRVERMEV